MKNLLQQIRQIIYPVYEQRDNPLYRNGKPFSICGLMNCNHENCHDIKKSNEKQHTCGSWPSPYWTQEDFIAKREACKNCPACQESNQP